MSRHNLLIIATWKKPVETLYKEVLSLQGNECRDIERQGF